jgi:L-ascorbate metabolism protein UlaG (beta-lactamase superfamily)
MEITWYGLSCFRLFERGYSAAVTDPYDHRVVGFEALKVRGDIVTVSHDAPGHNFTSGVKGKMHVIGRVHHCCPDERAEAQQRRSTQHAVCFRL